MKAALPDPTDENPNAAEPTGIAEAEEPVIRVAGLVKRFGDRAVLDGVNLEVAPGETMVVMGASGCG